MTEEAQTQAEVPQSGDVVVNDSQQTFDPNSDQPVKLAEYSDGSKPEDQAEKPSWHYSEEVPGKGDRPEWLLENYRNVEEMAKHAGSLRSKLGAFTGAPEEYEISLSKDIPEELTLDPKDPLLNDFKSFAKESNMSQSSFDKVIDLYMKHAQENMESSPEEAKKYYDDQMKELGDDGKDQLRVLEQWGNNNLPEDMRDTFRNSITDAKQVKMFNYLKNLTGYTNLPTGSNPGASVTREDLLDRMKNPQNLMGGEYEKKTQEMYNQFYGTNKDS